MNDLDHDVATFVVAHRTPLLTHLAHVVTFCGNEVTLAVLTAAAILTAYLLGRTRTAVVFAVGMAGSAVLTVGVKDLVGRARPGAAYRLGPPDSSYSFPSGHTLNTTVFVLMVVVALWPVLGVVARRAAVAAAGVVAVAMACSRVYLGYHWFTDVVAGLVIGVAWTLTLVALARRFAPLRPEPAGEVSPSVPLLTSRP